MEVRTARGSLLACLDNVEHLCYNTVTSVQTGGGSASRSRPVVVGICLGGAQIEGEHVTPGTTEQLSEPSEICQIEKHEKQLTVQNN